MASDGRCGLCTFGFLLIQCSRNCRTNSWRQSIMISLWSTRKSVSYNGYKKYLFKNSLSFTLQKLAEKSLLDLLFNSWILVLSNLDVLSLTKRHISNDIHPFYEESKNANFFFWQNYCDNNIYCSWSPTCSVMCYLYQNMYPPN